MKSYFQTDGTLVEGILDMNWLELQKTFGFTRQCREMLRQIKRILWMFKDCGSRRVYIDGSFTSLARRVQDFDLIWDPEGVDMARLDPLLKAPYENRTQMRNEYGGDVFALEASPREKERVEHISVLEVFQWKRNAPGRTSIVKIDLEGLL